jgi:hypothetical protein
MKIEIKGTLYSLFQMKDKSPFEKRAAEQPTPFAGMEACDTPRSGAAKLLYFSFWRVSQNDDLGGCSFEVSNFLSTYPYYYIL